MHNENDWLDSNCRNFHVKFSLLFCLIWLYLNEKINKKERYSDNNFFFFVKNMGLTSIFSYKNKRKTGNKLQRNRNDSVHSGKRTGQN